MFEWFFMLTSTTYAANRLAVLQVCLAVILLLALAMHLFSYPHMVDKRVWDASKSEALPALLPVMNREAPNTLYLRMEYAAPQNTKVQVFSAGCIIRLWVNEHPLPLNASTACDLSEGKIFDLAPELIEGTNRLLVEADRLGFLHVASLPPKDGLFWWMRAMMVLCACVMLFLLVQPLMQDRASGVIIAAGLAVFAHQFNHTNFMQYVMDMPWHLQYINYVAEYWRIPAPRDGWAFYHAPLYYCIEAVILVVGNVIGSFDPTSLLRLFSLGCFLVFLIFGALTLKLLVHNRLAYYVSLMLLVFYPSGIIFSSRLDSHLLFYPLYAGTLYYVLRWINDSKDKDFAIALGLFGVCLAARTNGYLLFPMVGGAFIYKWRQQGCLPVKLRSFVMVVGIIVFASGFAVNKGRSYYYSNFVYQDGKGIINVDRLGDDLRITNSIDKFLLLDTYIYFSRPFWDVWVDDNGRQYFWNSLLKSSLFGEFKWNHPMIAHALSIALLGGIFYAAYTMMMDRKYYLSRREWWMCMVTLWIPILALMRSRYNNAYASTQDFRYIYPALISFCGLIGLMLERQMTQRSGVLIAVPAFVIFACTSAIFFLIQ